MDRLTDATRGFSHSLPHSRIVYPDRHSERLKYFLWRVITPVHPYMRETLDRVGFIKLRYQKYRPDERQKYLLGYLAPEETIESVVQFLIEKGYGNHFVALKDKGEVVSLRYTPTFKHQYHIRIFEDGEVRTHYEYTPECHPYLHDIEVGFEERRDYFLELLESKIIPS